MKRKARHRSESSPAWNLKHQASEMVGLWELGLINDALVIAQKILSADSLHKEAFVLAVRLIMETDNPRAHEPLIIPAFKKLSKASQRWASCKVFHFYDQIGETQTAAKYISLDYTESGYLLCCMLFLLNLKRVEEAGQVFRIAQRQLKKASSDYDRSNLLAVMAEHYSHTGKVEEAEQLWLRVIKCNEPAYLAAVPELIKIQVARALLYVELGIATTEAFAKQDGEKIVLADARQGKAPQVIVKILKEYREALEKIVPQKDLWRYGVNFP